MFILNFMLVQNHIILVPDIFLFWTTTHDGLVGPHFLNMFVWDLEVDSVIWYYTSLTTYIICNGQRRNPDMTKLKT